MNPHPTDLTEYANFDVKLVLSDMDGTLLDSEGRVPPGLWDVLAELSDRGIIFVPASGRQYATLVNHFPGHTDGMPIIAENGSLVMRDGVEIASVPLSREFVVSTIELLRSLKDHGRNLGVVLAGKKRAYVERHDDAFMEQVNIYYQANEQLENQLDYDDEIVKIAVHDFDDAESGTLPYVRHLRETHNIVVSGEHWIDMMDRRANKGFAVAKLQEKFGILPEETLAFGDYPNDVEMLQSVGYPVVMANGHETVLPLGKYIAPTNDEAGVVQVLRALLK